MIRCFLTSCLSVLFISSYGQVLQRDLSTSSYSTSLLEATNSIRLAPGYSATAGTVLTARITTPKFAAEPVQNLNFIKIQESYDALTSTNFDIAIPTQKSISYQYFDGLGRLSQTVMVKGSPNFADIVVPVSYDAYGQQLKSYLPYVVSPGDGAFKLNALTNQAAFYSPSLGEFNEKIKTDSTPFSQAIIEKSPLARVLQNGSTGTTWQPDELNFFSSSNKAVKFGYGLNIDGVGSEQERIVKWAIVSDLPSNNGYYETGKLFVKITYDEDNRQVREYATKEGLVILKKVQYVSSTPSTNVETDWAQTYYVYDELQLLRFVLPPEFCSRMGAGINSALVNDWAFQYKYDGLKRMVIKKVPGANPVEMVYDKWDRVVATRDANQQLANKWLFTKYDVLNRVIMTGEYSNATDRASMQASVNSYYAANPLNRNESPTAGSVGYTTTTSYPTVITESDLLAVTFYDDYSFITNLSLTGFSFSAVSGFTGTQNNYIKGQVTGSKVKVLNSSPAQWLIQVNYYDSRYRSLQTVSTDYLGNTNRTTNEYYGITSWVLKSRTEHGASWVNTIEREYDHAGRVLQVYSTINNNARVMLAHNKYNEVGQLVEKNLHSVDNGDTFKQSLDYRYNIRGWLTSINNSSLTSDGLTNDDANDLYGMNLLYEQQDAGLGNAAQYNGNISAIAWSANLGLSTEKQRGYNFSYDPLNRLMAATFRSREASWQTSGSFHENGFQYDRNGNILNLNRKGAAASDLDILAYTYQGNQLLKVDDTGDKTKGFIEPTSTTGNDYSYDGNGNMTVDQNKGITSIAYNYLNLPAQITKNTGEYIKYIYDATGRKLRQEVYNASSALQKSTDYAGEFIYENSSLTFINHEEGRIIPTGNEYQYHLKDHLGNVRLTFTTQTTTQQVTAGFEATNQSTEAANFPNSYPSGGQINTLATNASTGTNSELLNGGYSGRVGLAKSFSVMPGDVVQLQAYAKYSEPTTTGVDYANFVASLLSAFNLPAPLPGEMGTAASGVNSFGLWEISPSGDINEEDPMKVFATIILFDRDYNFIDVAYSASTSSGALINATYTARQPGYAYLYISNEHPYQVDAYFDDVTFTHTPGLVVQQEDYYPFGLTFNSYQRENSVAQDYKYNGFEVQDELALGWYDYLARQYDPATARFTSIDPAANLMRRVSPYVYAFNNPIRFIDPDGMIPSDKVRENETDPERTAKSRKEKDTGSESKKGDKKGDKGGKRKLINWSNLGIGFKQLGLYILKSVTGWAPGIGTTITGDGEMDPEQGRKKDPDDKHVQVDMDEAENMEDPVEGKKKYKSARNAAKDYVDGEGEKVIEEEAKEAIKKAKERAYSNDTIYQCTGACNDGYTKNPDGSYTKTKATKGPKKQMPSGFHK
jgi:RHS repeat-associated protein